MVFSLFDSILRPELSSANADSFKIFTTIVRIFFWKLP